MSALYEVILSDMSGAELTGGSPDATGAVLWGNGPVYAVPDLPVGDYVNPADEQPVHPFTRWRLWQMLPAEYRRLDQTQGRSTAVAWHGYNQDPRFILGWDGWARRNISTSEAAGKLELSRVFRGVSARETHVQLWTYGRGAPVDVELIAEDSAGRVLASGAGVTAPEGMSHASVSFTPRFDSVVVVRVRMSLDAPLEAARIGGIHVGARTATFDELPGVAEKTESRWFPLMRYMDAWGYVLGSLYDIANAMHAGAWSHPRTCPDEALQWLAMMLGVPPRQRPENLALLREHLVHYVEAGTPAPGSRASIVEVAQRWLIGSKSATVLPAQQYARYLNDYEQAVVDAAGITDPNAVIWYQDTAPSVAMRYSWLGTPNNSTSLLHSHGIRVAENGVPNPSFTLGIDNWTIASGWTVEHDAAFGRSRAGSAKITRDADGGYFVQNEHSIAGQPGKWVGSAYVYSETATRTRLRLWTYSAADKTIGTDEGKHGAYVDVPAQTWTRLDVSTTLTEATGYVRISLQDDVPGVIWLDDVMLAREHYAAPRYFDGDTPDSVANDIWIQPKLANDSTAAPYIYRWANDAWTQDIAPPSDLYAAAKALQTNFYTMTFADAHTIVLLVRPDEVPYGDIAAFAKFVQDSGAVPVGHKLVAREERSTWADYERAAGITWAEKEANIKTWLDNDSAGIELETRAGE